MGQFYLSPVLASGFTGIVTYLNLVIVMVIVIVMVMVIVIVIVIVMVIVIVIVIVVVFVIVIVIVIVICVFLPVWLLIAWASLSYLWTASFQTRSDFCFVMDMAIGFMFPAGPP